ncbi:MAG: choice-of-anchor D domain-containing protein [Deltaproteobacteria bacterium]|nr:choice-of-anchor D domain-containing protein [Deltaproteobacteria bacterium]
MSPDIVVEIELAPTAAAGQALVVDFSDVVVTNTAKRNLILSNKGRRSLQISDAKYTGDKSFSYSKLPTALGQGETGKVIAAFAPTEVGEFTGTLVLTTNDPDAKAVTITFKGTGADPNVLVCTPPLDVTEDNCKPGKRVLDFGPTIEKFSRKRFLRIGAIGGSDVLLSSATVSNVEGPKCAKAALDQAFVTDAVDNPTRVESLTNWPLGITFTPPCPGEYSAELIIETNDPRNPSPRVTLVGVGEQDCVAYSETYTSKVTVDNKVDVLFVIDESYSMNDTQESVKFYAKSFVQELNNPTLPVDFHIGAISTDLDASGRSGKLVSATFTSGAFSEQIKIITRNSLIGAPNAADRGPVKAFEHLMDQFNTNGSSDEYGFAAVAVALTTGGNYTFTNEWGSPKTVAGAANLSTSADLSKPNGFLRPDARFYAIIITDADDVTGDANVQQHIDYIKQLKGLVGKPGVPAGFKQKLLDKPDDNLAIFVIGEPSVSGAPACPMPSNWKIGDPPYGNEASNTPVYHKFVTAMGKSGQFIPLCSDFAKTLSSIGKIIAKADCTFAVQQGQVTVDEENTLCIQGGVCFDAADYKYTPPGENSPFGTVTIVDNKCPTTESSITFDYTACLRTPDGDKDTVPDLMDNCPFVQNTDQKDENSDGIGDLCIADPNKLPD